MSDRLWVITDGNEHGLVLSGLLVRAETDVEAAAIAFEQLHEDDDENLPQSVFVVAAEGGRFIRATYGAEPVPAEFQCCGGMPHLATLGTYDEHNAICPNFESEPTTEGGA